MSEQDKLTCTKPVLRNDGSRDNQGRLRTWHEKCGAPASECEVGGLLTTAKAILCSRHRILADRESFISSNGFKMGKVEHPDKYKQRRLPGTGLKGEK
jgi:hypothetical protein